MNNQNGIAILGITALVVAGSITFSNGMFQINETPNTTTETVGLQGHFTIEQIDEEGNTVRFIQTDNAIPALGKTCALARIFVNPATASNSTANSWCRAQSAGVFDYIGLGSTGTTEAETDIGYAGTQVAVSNQITDIGILNGTSAGQPEYATVRYTWNAGTFSGSAINEVVIAAGNTIGTSGGAGDPIFARKVITTISPGASDSLTVTWRVTAG